VQKKAFTAGVEFGGLTDLQDIKVLICYILSVIKNPISKPNMVSALQSVGICNYFDTINAFSDLEDKKNLVCTDIKGKFYKLSESGKIIVEQLSNTLPYTVKQHSLEIIENFIKNLKSASENEIITKKNNVGYDITCNISGSRDFNLMSITMYVPSLDDAANIKENFQENPGIIYRGLLAIMTRNTLLLRETVEELAEKKSEDVGI
jgi:hypothetical protein